MHAGRRRASRKGWRIGQTVKALAKKYQAEILTHHKRPELANGYLDRAVLPALGHRKVKDVTRADLVD